jgi:hypothetical protein
MPEGTAAAGAPRLDPTKFRDPEVTARGERRAVVALTRLKTLWFNTGSLCNLTCVNCYIESSPTNDRLVYLTAAEVAAYLDEVARERLPVEEVGFTGGEPFMNREFPEMVRDALGRGFRVLVLTNAMKPLWNRREALLAAAAGRRDALTLRVSIDHYSREGHERLRGPGSWEPVMKGLRWLVDNDFPVAVAGRTCFAEPPAVLRAGYARLFAGIGLLLDAFDPAHLVLFPEMDAALDVPEITTACWSILGVAPETMMCATSRMVVKRKGAERPTVLPCTLLPYDPQFELGHDLATAARAVPLNHPHCARFCVLGGGSCCRPGR